MKPQYNPENERIKREFYQLKIHAHGKSEGTLDSIRHALRRFEKYTRFKSFKTFNASQARGFKEHTQGLCAQRTGEPLSKATMLSTLKALKEFFGWLSLQKGYRKHICSNDVEYLNLSLKETSIAKARKYRPFPTLQQIGTVLDVMPSQTVLERRNRALIAFSIISGMRDGAIVSLSLRHVDMNHEPILIRQEADRVNTKFSKTMTTYLFKLNPAWEKIVRDWIDELTHTHRFGFNDPLFPATHMMHDENACFKAGGLSRKHWSTATSMRDIFRQAFETIGLPYYSPHSFRHTLGHAMSQFCTTFEDMQAWSQNLGHESIATTSGSYARLDPYRQGQVLGQMASSF